MQVRYLWSRDGGHETFVSCRVAATCHKRDGWFFIYLCSSFNSFLIPFAPLLPIHLPYRPFSFSFPSRPLAPPTRRNVLSSNVPHSTDRLGAGAHRLQALCEPRTVIPPSVRLPLWRASEWGVPSA